LLDRDGVVNIDRTDYTKSPDEWRALPGSLHAIVQLQAAGYALPSVQTKQALGVAFSAQRS